MISVEQLFDYLKEKVPDFAKTAKKGNFLFTCPNVGNHKFKSSSPTATFITGSDKIACLTCGFRGTIYDVIRLVEKKTMTDEEVISFLTNELDVNAYPELDSYQSYGWYIFGIAQNGKMPLKDEHWREKEFCFTDKSKWLNWIQSGFNIAVNCEFSNVMIVDFDDKEVSPESIALRDEFKQLLEDSKTLIQNTPNGGRHYVFQYDAELCFKQKVDMGGLKIDTRTHKGYFLVSPSKINNTLYNWVNIGAEIKTVPENLKVKLLQIMDLKRNNEKELLIDVPKVSTELPKLKNNNLEGCCNDTFVRLGGLFIKQGLEPREVELVLSIINTQLLESPMPSFAIKAMIGSLAGYKETEEQTQEKAIYECCTLLQTDISAKDIMEHVFPDDKKKKAIVNKYLAQFHKEGKLVRKAHGKYDLKEKVEWTDEVQAVAPECEYTIPYFDDLAYFHSGDIILIGGKTGEGKTHIAMNLIKQFKAQGIKPFYISLESGSRHEKVAQQLGLSQKDYYVSKDAIDNPLQMEIETNSVTIVDWLYTGEDFAATQSIFKHLSDEMKRKGGILIVFTQLKESYDWFAVNLIKSFARFAARFIYDDTDGIASHFDVCKITDPKGHYSTAIVSTEFNFESKELKKKLNL